MQTFAVTLSGNSYELRYTTRAIRRLEQELGYSVLSSEFLADRGVDRLVKMLWAGLLHSDKTLTIDHVYDLVDNFGSDVLKAVPVVNDAFNYFWGATESKEPTVEPEEKKTESL